MKRILALTILTCSYFLGQSQGIQRWFEDFEGGAANSVSGTAAGTPGGTWSVTTTPTGGAASFSKQTHSFDRFTINQTGNEGVWASSVVNITSTGQAALDISLVSYYGGAGDYVRVYYKLNGGPEVMFGEALGQAGAYNITSQASIVLTGNSVQIIVRGRENTTGSTGGYPNMMRFDDVEITQVSTLYSRNGGGNWGSNGTWSTAGLNGASCGCTPDNTTNVVVGNSDIVSITAASDVINATVQSSSTLRWTAGVALTLSRGGSMTVSNTAQVNHNGNTGASIIYPVAAAVGLTVNSSNANAVLIGDILVSGNTTLTISGTGNIGIADDFLVSGAANIANNSSGTITIGDDLIINPASSSASFTNAGPMTIGGITTITAPSTFTNNNAVTMSNAGAGTLAGTGTWTQGTNANSLLNYAGSTLTVSTFNASNTGNTVNYNRPGVATLRNPSSASTYYNLTIAGSSIKSSSAAHIVNNNLIISGSNTNAGVNPLTFNFTVNGTTTITVGSFNDSNDAGVNTFVGNVSNASTFNSTSVTTTGNLVFRGGIANTGTFTAGGATFNTNNQPITGTSAMSFANDVAINGFTVTNSNSGAFTVTGTTTLTAGGYTDSNNAGVTTFVGLVSKSGGASTFNTTAVSTPANLIFRGGITNGGGTFTAGAATFNTNAQSIAGTAAISFANFVVVTGVAVSNDNTSSVSVTASGLSLSGTGSWTQGTNSTLIFGGSSITTSTFNASAVGNEVNYTSTSNAQTIRTPTSTYTDLTFNNTFGTSPQLTATGDVSVTRFLTMTAGNVNLNTNDLTLTSSAAGSLVHGSTSASGWLYGGSFTRTFLGSSAVAIGNVRGLFPLGGSADFRPFFVSNNTNTNTAGTITVSHTDEPTSSSVSFNDGATPILIRSNSFWTLSTATMSGGLWRVQYGGTGLGIVANVAHLRSVLSGSTINTNAGGSGTPTDPRVERSNIAFANFANNYYVGSTNVASPLPIKLTYFKAAIDHDIVNLDWATAQEINNEYFTIEKSSNPEQGFQEVSKVASQGNSTFEQQYFSQDKYPYSGLSYYRLKQTDFDGSVTYSKLVSVNYEGSTLALLTVHPNPLKNKQTVNVEISGLKNTSEIQLVIYNFLGEKILKKTISVNHAGKVQEELFFEKPLTPGVFVIKAGPTLQLTQRLVVE